MGQIPTFAFYGRDPAHCSLLTSQSLRAVSLLCGQAWYLRFHVEEVGPAHTFQLRRCCEPNQRFRALFWLARHRIDDRHGEIFISTPLLRLKPVATSPGWKQFAVTPLPARRRANSDVKRIFASLVSP